MRCGDGEDLAAGAAGVLGGGVEEHADLAAGVGQVGVAAAEDGGACRSVGGVSPTMTRMVVDLPAPLGPRKPVTRPGRAVKVTSSTAVKAAVRPGECVDLDHGDSLAAAAGSAHIGDEAPTRP